MEKLEKRTVIKYFYLKSLTPIQIKEKMDSTQKNSSPSYLTVKQWIFEFKKSRTSTDDEPGSRRLIEVSTGKMFEKIHKIVLKDRRLKMSAKAETTGISTERVHNILHQHLCMETLCVRWVPRLLTIDQKLCRKIDLTTENLALYKRNSCEFLTVDET